MPPSTTDHFAVNLANWFEAAVAGCLALHRLFRLPPGHVRLPLALSISATRKG